jgi:hypothetical protein
MLRVGKALVVKIDAGVSWVIRAWSRLTVLALKALQSGPRLDQGPSEGEGLSRDQTLRASLAPDRLKSPLRDLNRELFFPVCGKHGDIANRIVYPQPHVWAEPEIVIDLLREVPLATHQEQQLQRQDAQNLQPVAPRVNCVASGSQLSKLRIERAPDSLQPMILAVTLPRRFVPEDQRLLTVCSALPALSCTNSHRLTFSVRQREAFRLPKSLKVI